MKICYPVHGVLPLRDTTNGGRPPPDLQGGGEMVTYENLFAYSMVLIAVIALVLDCVNRNK